jgi:hypothetical protein
MATAESRFELITRNLQEVLGEDSIKAILAERRNPKCYWGRHWRCPNVILAYNWWCFRYGAYRST